MHYYIKQSCTDIKKNILLDSFDKFKQLQIECDNMIYKTTSNGINYETRSGNMFYRPFMNTSIGQMGYEYQRSKLWSSLPNEIKTIKSKITFKKEITKLLISQTNCLYQSL